MDNRNPDWLDWFGVRNLPDVRKARWLGGLLSTIGAVIVLGVFGLTFYEFFLALTGTGGFATAKDQSEAIRNIGLVLAAIVGVPFVVWRTAVAHKQADTAAQALFNDKINAASDDLHAMRQRWDGENNVWEPDVVRRNAAIDRLEGLVRERPEEAPRVSRLLSVYVREMSREVPAEVMPEKLSPQAMGNWAQALPVKRSDMENAVQTLGRLRGIDGAEPENIAIDLRGANLQGFDLRGFDLTGANLSEAQMQGACFKGTVLEKAHLFDTRMQGVNLHKAQLEGADLSWAQMQGAQLREAQLKGADLSWVRLQGANLHSVRLQGTDLFKSELQGLDLTGVEVDAKTDLTLTDLRGSAVRMKDYSTIDLPQDQIEVIFGDGSVILPGGVTPNHPDWPPHFAKEVLGGSEFHKAWRAFQKNIGFAPDDPSTW